MVFATEHIHVKDLEFNPSLRQVNEKKEYFVRGEGWQKARKTISIPEFECEKHLGYEKFVQFVLNNETYVLDYISKYGWRIITDQLGISFDDYSTKQEAYLLKHLSSHPELVDYIRETYAVYKKFIELYSKEQDWLSFHLSYLFDDFKTDFRKFCLFDWMIGTWNIRTLSLSMNGTKNEPFLNFLDAYKEHYALGEVSYVDILNTMEDGFGKRVNDVLTFSPNNKEKSNG